MNKSEFIQLLKDVKETQFRKPENKIRCPRLKKMKAFIDEHMPNLKTKLQEWSEEKDTKIGRLRSPGATYYGYRLQVFNIHNGEELLDHRTTETYRCNADVAEFILKQLKGD